MANALTVAATGPTPPRPPSPEAAVATDFTNPTHVARWRLRRLRRIAWVFGSACVLAGAAEVAFGTPAVAYVYGLDVVALAGVLVVADERNHRTVERIAFAIAYLTSALCVVLTGQLANAAFFILLASSSTVHEVSPRWRVGWQLLTAVSLAGTAAYFRVHPPAPAGLESYLTAAVPVAATAVGLALLFFEYVEIDRRVVQANAALNARVADQLERARATGAALRDRLEARRRVSASIEQSVASAHRTRSRLQANQEQLEQFAYAASHDLKEPVRTIKSFMRMAQRRMPPEAAADEALAEHFAFVQSNADAMHEVLDRLLLYSRAVAEATTDPELVDVTRAWQRAIARAGLPADVAQAPLLALRDLPAATVAIDPRQLQRLLTELLTNAARFTAPAAAPVIRIAVAPTPEGGVVTRLTDEGIGFDPAYTEQVFGLFKRLHPREEYPSAGVGLAIVRRICDRLGIRVRVETAIGRGTAVELTFPPAAAERP